jgi:hypothetical protein
MTQEEIIELAKQAGMLQINGKYNIWIPEYLYEFAALVAAAERKAWADEFAGLGEWTCVHIIEGTLGEVP